MTKSNAGRSDFDSDFDVATAGAIFRLIYRSKSLLPKAGYEPELGAIFRIARANNKTKGVTGALLRYDDWFVQALEGEEAAVRGLFDKIEKDPRHEAVEVLETGMVSERVFARWAMAEIAEHGEPDIPLIATQTGIAEAASRNPTSEQERILDIMRQATRGYGKGY
jgi:Sensors of blue-light using FAD